MFAFVEWHNDWLFKSEKDRITITEPELKILKGIAQYAKETPPTPKGEIKLNLTDVQNNSMKDLGWVIKIDDVNPLIEKKLMGDKLMEEAGVFSTVRLEDIEKMAPFWEILYSLKKLSR
jgi:CRP/FNR family cyclic AMP-dependent transcriptional regulator